MAEIQLTRIKSIYGDLKGLLNQVPLTETNSMIDEFLVIQLNNVLDNLTRVADTDFSQYKVPENKRIENWQEKFPTDIVRVQLGRVISRLESEYNFGEKNHSQTPGIVIFNKNESEISLKINYSISDLISRSTDGESKRKLAQLDEELNKAEKNWETIKGILIWILNFSKNLFLEILPIILQKKL
jgi:hypothetical protein